MLPSTEISTSPSVLVPNHRRAPQLLHLNNSTPRRGALHTAASVVCTFRMSQHREPPPQLKGMPTYEFILMFCPPERNQKNYSLEPL
jgi:hypothetical protein